MRDKTQQGKPIKANFVGANVAATVDSVKPVSNERRRKDKPSVKTLNVTITKSYFFTIPFSLLLVINVFIVSLFKLLLFESIAKIGLFI